MTNTPTPQAQAHKQTAVIKWVQAANLSDLEFEKDKVIFNILAARIFGAEQVSELYRQSQHTSQPFTLANTLRAMKNLDSAPSIVLDIEQRCLCFSKFYSHKDSEKAEWNLNLPDDLSLQLDNSPELTDFFYSLTQS